MSNDRQLQSQRLLPVLLKADVASIPTGDMVKAANIRLLKLLPIKNIIGTDGSIYRSFGDIYRGKGFVDTARVARHGAARDAFNRGLTNDALQISQSAIYPELRGIGLGRKLYGGMFHEALKGHLQGSGIDFVQSHAIKVSDAARRLWESLMQRGYPITKLPNNAYSLDLAALAKLRPGFLKKSSQAYAPPAGPWAVFVVAPHGDGYAATTRAADRGEAGRIGLPGGKVDPDEDPAAAAIREAMEEGWDVSELDPEPAHKMEVEGRPVWWYRAGSATPRTEYKEQGRITPVTKALQEIIESGYGNEWLGGDQTKAAALLHSLGTSNTARRLLKPSAMLTLALVNARCSFRKLASGARQDPHAFSVQDL